ncbi:MAG: methyltransferase domain-containing protein [Alphaproteobacteria bacterium]|nr:methyltransferase domain-containing protein [Alphaproteobacteria bacterium]
MSRKARIAAAFDAAAGTYDAASDLQRRVAESLAADIKRLTLPPHPRILEVGCGTGFLTRALDAVLADADWTLTDLSLAMLDKARDALSAPPRCHVMDGEHPDLSGPYDLICSAMTVQWFDDPERGLERLASLLAPGGWLAVTALADGTFREWRKVLDDLGLAVGAHAYPTEDELRRWLGGRIRWTFADCQSPHADAHAFLRAVKNAGAHLPVDGHAPLAPGAMRRALRALDRDGGFTVTYRVGFALLNAGA